MYKSGQITTYTFGWNTNRLHDTLKVSYLKSHKCNMHHTLGTVKWYRVHKIFWYYGTPTTVLHAGTGHFKGIPAQCETKLQEPDICYPTNLSQCFGQNTLWALSLLAHQYWYTPDVWNNNSYLVYTLPTKKSRIWLLLWLPSISQSPSARNAPLTLTYNIHAHELHTC